MDNKRVFAPGCSGGGRTMNKFQYENHYTYKNYNTITTFCPISKVYHGKIENIKDLVTYETENHSDIEKEFCKAVDDYLIFCEEVNKKPESVKMK